MILEAEQWYLGYSQIIRDCRPDDDGAAGSALILCNADVDAMCAARILAYMLRSDGVSYHLLPCSTYRRLQSVLSRKKSDDVRAVVLLNLGASRNLTRLFDAAGGGDDDAGEGEGENGNIRNGSTFLVGLDPSVKVYVMDFRRPVHLANIHAGNNVVVFWDPTVDDVPSDGDNLSGDDDSSSSSSSSGGDEGDDDEDDEISSDGEEEHEFEDAPPGDQADDGGGGIDEGRKTSSPERGSDDADAAVAGEQGPDYDGDRDGDQEDSMSLDDGDRDGEKGRGDERGEDDEDVAAATGASSTQQMTQPTMTPRELHQQRRDRLRAYYSSGTFHGSPAAYVAYRVATQLRFGDSGDLLWLACVGVTDSYLHSRLDVAGYSALALFLRQNCARLYPSDMYSRVENAAYAEHLTGSGAAAGDGGGLQFGGAQELTKIGFSENGRILSESDFRFFLLRHTSLYCSMVHSDFVSTRLQLVTKRGVERLQELLAKMGYPLEECNQPFAFMKPSLRRRLPDQMRQHCEEYGLDNFEYTGFFRVTGYQSLLSAADTSYAVTALLECDLPGGVGAAVGNSATDADEVEERKLLQSFNYAYDALNSNEAPTVSLGGLTGGEGSNLASLVNGGNLSSGGTGLGTGIKLAMAVQRTIIQTAQSLIERSAITRLDHFRYAYITCTSQGDKEGAAAGSNGVIPPGKGASEEEKHHIFAKPLALTRLAHYLIDLHRVNGKWVGANASPMVLVLLAEKPRTKTYLVVAYEYAEEPGHFVRNKFGKNFELAAQSMQGTFRFDSFDTNVVEVSANDVQRFIEQLHYLMESM